jgi:hypothetical protein
LSTVDTAAKRTSSLMSCRNGSTATRTSSEGFTLHYSYIKYRFTSI